MALYNVAALPKRPFLLSLLLVSLACGWACWCDTALLWDGAYQLLQTLLTGRPFFYLSRFHSWLLWQPVVRAAPYTDSLRLLRLLYGLPFCFAPLTGLLLSWGVVCRSAPHLQLWAMLGVLLGSLPGQIFMINDSIFQLHLFWPVFLAAFVPLSPGQALVLVAVSLFQLSHPIGIALCGGLALLAAGAAWQGRPEERRARAGKAGWLLLLAVGGWLKLKQWPDDYAAQEATWTQVLNTFSGGVLGWPLLALVCTWAAGGLLGRTRLYATPEGGRRAGRMAVAALLGAGVVLLWWAADPGRWRTALSYRRWVVPMSAPFFLAALSELRRGERTPLRLPPVAWHWRRQAGLVAAFVFLLVLGTQALQTRQMLERLRETVREHESPWLREEEIPWIRPTALSHWGLAGQVLLLQGRTPALLLQNPEGVAAAGRKPPAVAIAPFDVRAPAENPGSWFHWEKLPPPPPRDGSF